LLFLKTIMIAVSVFSNTSTPLAGRTLDLIQQTSNANGLVSSLASATGMASTAGMTSTANMASTAGMATGGGSAALKPLLSFSVTPPRQVLIF
jgi:hypothetical protein